jgi:hypothetical protein
MGVPFSMNIRDGSRFARSKLAAFSFTRGIAVPRSIYSTYLSIL